MTSAHTLYSQGRFDESKATYLESLERDGLNPLTLKQLGEIALWENKCVEAERHFEQALQHLQWYQRLWPFNAQLKYRLALTYYRQDCFDKAALYFREAAGPIALGPFRELRAFAQQMGLFGRGSPYAIEGPDSTRIAFLCTDPLPVIEVSINGSDPLNFFIDTGGAEVILDRELAVSIEAQMSGAFWADYAGQKKAETGLGKIDSIQLGEIVIRNVPIHTLDMKEMSAVFDGLKVSGVIGTRLLMHFLSTIDYAGGSLILRRSTSSNARDLATSFRESVAKNIPFWLVDMHCMVAWGTINGQGPMLFFVDTGLANRGFTATESVLRQAGIGVNWTDAKAGIGGAGETKVVDIRIDRLTLLAGLKKRVILMMGCEIDWSASSGCERTSGFRTRGAADDQNGGSVGSCAGSGSRSEKSLAL